MIATRGPWSIPSEIDNIAALNDNSQLSQDRIRVLCVSKWRAFLGIIYGYASETLLYEGSRRHPKQQDQDFFFKQATLGHINFCEHTTTGKEILILEKKAGCHCFDTGQIPFLAIIQYYHIISITILFSITLLSEMDCLSMGIFLNMSQDLQALLSKVVWNI